MNRLAFLLATLAFAATASFVGAAERAKEKPVVVDPLDLRTPVPDPEKELSEKYDGKTVVFSGKLQSTGRDATTKQRWYKLVVPVIQEQSRPSAKPKMQTVTVQVYFAPRERHLPKRSAPYTVQGTAEITVTGSLIIHNARIVSSSLKKTANR